MVVIRAEKLFFFPKAYLTNQDMVLFAQFKCGILRFTLACGILGMKTLKAVQREKIKALLGKKKKNLPKIMLFL